MPACNSLCHEKECLCATCAYMCSRCLVSDNLCIRGVHTCDRYKQEYKDVKEVVNSHKV